MRRSALSPVIASIILSAMVLVIGAGVWSYSNSAASVIAGDYANETIEMVNTIEERFIIEHACFDNNTHIFSLWVYNYGDVGNRINSIITINNEDYNNNSIFIEKDNVKEITFDVGESLAVNEDAIIYIITSRGNSIRETYYII